MYTKERYSGHVKYSVPISGRQTVYALVHTCKYPQERDEIYRCFYSQGFDAMFKKFYTDPLFSRIKRMIKKVLKKVVSG